MPVRRHPPPHFICSKTDRTDCRKHLPRHGQSSPHLFFAAASCLPLFLLYCSTFPAKCTDEFQKMHNLHHFWLSAHVPLRRIPAYSPLCARRPMASAPIACRPAFLPRTPAHILPPPPRQSAAASLRQAARQSRPALPAFSGMPAKAPFTTLPQSIPKAFSRAAKQRQTQQSSQPSCRVPSKAERPAQPPSHCPAVRQPSKASLRHGSGSVSKSPSYRPSDQPSGMPLPSYSHSVPHIALSYSPDCRRFPPGYKNAPAAFP